MSYSVRGLWILEDLHISRRRLNKHILLVVKSSFDLYVLLQRNSIVLSGFHVIDLKRKKKKKEKCTSWINVISRSRLKTRSSIQYLNSYYRLFIIFLTKKALPNDSLPESKSLNWDTLGSNWKLICKPLHF